MMNSTTLWLAGVFLAVASPGRAQASTFGEFVPPAGAPTLDEMAGDWKTRVEWSGR